MWIQQSSKNDRLASLSHIYSATWYLVTASVFDGGYPATRVALPAQHGLTWYSTNLAPNNQQAHRKQLWHAEVSGGAHQQEATKQAAACLTWMKAQILQIRKTFIQITSRISDDSGTLQAEEDQASAGRALIKASQKLVASCRVYSGSLCDQVGVHEAEIDDLEKYIHSAQLQLQCIKLGGAADDSVDSVCCAVVDCQSCAFNSSTEVAQQRQPAREVQIWSSWLCCKRA